MKAFRFQLDQVLKWRSSQVDVEKARLAAAVARVAELQRDAATLEAQLTTEVAAWKLGTSGAELSLWDAYYRRTRKRIADLHVLAAEAEAALSTARQSLVEADRRLKLLQNLRDTRYRRWAADWSRELEAFAAESFLSKLQLENGRARSSSG